jgi:CRP-like cAMP-binding protein
MNKTPLKRYIKNLIAIDENELDRFCDLFTYKKVKKKDYLLRQGDICRHESFVLNGFLRQFHTDNSGKEHTMNFSTVNWWVNDIGSFINQSKSYISIQALADSELLQINFQNKQKAYDEIQGIDRLFRVMTQRSHVAYQQRILSHLTHTAEERYLTFVKKYPDIRKHLSNIQIASYLGITHEFVSKIKKSIYLNRSKKNKY